MSWIYNFGIHTKLYSNYTYFMQNKTCERLIRSNRRYKYYDFLNDLQVRQTYFPVEIGVGTMQHSPKQIYSYTNNAYR